MPEEGDLLTANNYLDIVFRLLHEDAIHDLRNGVNYMSKLDLKQFNWKELLKKIKVQQIKLHLQLSI